MILTGCGQSALTGCNVTVKMMPREIKRSANSHDGFLIAISRVVGSKMSAFGRLDLYASPDLDASSSISELARHPGA
jgi:hypothetical protein